MSEDRITSSNWVQTRFDNIFDRSLGSCLGNLLTTAILTVFTIGATVFLFGELVDFLIQKIIVPVWAILLLGSASLLSIALSSVWISSRRNNNNSISTSKNQSVSLLQESHTILQDALSDLGAQPSSDNAKSAALKAVDRYKKHAIDLAELHGFDLDNPEMDHEGVTSVLDKLTASILEAPYGNWGTAPSIARRRKGQVQEIHKLIVEAIRDIS